jgi:hypothetical protein
VTTVPESTVNGAFEIEQVDDVLASIVYVSCKPEVEYAEIVVDDVLTVELAAGPLVIAIL